MGEGVLVWYMVMKLVVWLSGRDILKGDERCTLVRLGYPFIIPCSEGTING